MGSNMIHPNIQPQSHQNHSSKHNNSRSVTKKSKGYTKRSNNRSKHSYKDKYDSNHKRTLLSDGGFLDTLVAGLMIVIPILLVISAIYLFVSHPLFIILVIIIILALAYLFSKK